MHQATIQITDQKGSNTYIEKGFLTGLLVTQVNSARSAYKAAHSIEDKTSRAIERAYYRAIYSRLIFLAQELDLNHPDLKLKLEEKTLGAKGD